jgi:hypothetical protein
MRRNFDQLPLLTAAPDGPQNRPGWPRTNTGARSAWSRFQGVLTVEDSGLSSICAPVGHYEWVSFLVTSSLSHLRCSMAAVRIYLVRNGSPKGVTFRHFFAVPIGFWLHGPTFVVHAQLSAWPALERPATDQHGQVRVTTVAGKSASQSVSCRS